MWGLTYPSLLYPISVLQKKILSIITFGDKNAPSTPAVDCVKVFKFNDMIMGTMHIVCFVYECVHNLSPAYFYNYLIWIENVHNFGTRQSRIGDLFALCCNTTQYGHRSIHYLVVCLWNSRSTDIQNLVSLSIFGSKIKSYFLSNYSIT